MALNILIVDDCSVMREMIKKTIQISGLPIGEIKEASNGKEGLQLITEGWIDLALVDIHMPVMSGEDMIAEIRKDPVNKDLAIIVVSSESNYQRIELLKQEGAKFLHKPFTPENLSEMVTVMLGEIDED